jgi:hypothetical protein
MTKDKKKEEIKVNIIKVGNLSFEEQLERINKFNDAFIDIAVKYHVDKIKEKSTK